MIALFFTVLFNALMAIGLTIATHVALFASAGYETYIIVGAAVCFFTTSMLLIATSFSSYRSEWLREYKTKQQIRDDGLSWAVVPIYNSFSFLVLCMSLYAIFGEAAFVGVGPQTYKAYVSDLSPYAGWFWYLIDQTLRVVTLDFMDVFYVSLSDIRHADSLLVCSLILVYRLTMGLGLLNTAYWSIKLIYAGSSNQVQLPETDELQEMLDERHAQYMRETYGTDAS